MNNKSFCLEALRTTRDLPICLASLALVFLCLAASADPQPLFWFSLNRASGTMAGDFDSVTQHYLQQHPEAIQLQDHTGTIQALKIALKDLAHAAQKPDILIRCNPDEYSELQGDPEIGSLLRDLGIQLINPRLNSLPLFLVGYAESASALQSTISKLNPVPVAFLTLPYPHIHPVEEPDLQTMISELIGRPKTTIRIFPERQAYTAAKKLFDGTYGLVAVYEDDPSTLLDELQVNLTKELKAHPPRILSLEKWKPDGQINSVAPERLRYVYFVFPSGSFYDPQLVPPDVPLPAIIQESKHKFPLLLSNSDPALQKRVLQAASYGYFLGARALPEKMDEQERRNLQQLYLLNAYLNDSENPFKELGYLGYLLLMKDRHWDDSRRKEMYEEKCDLLSRQMKIAPISAKAILDRLGIAVPPIDKRRLFTDDVSRLYQNALAEMESGLKSAAPDRVPKLEAARRDLIASLLQGDEPKNVKGSRGLWSIQDYNPYYELARVTFYLQLEENHKAGGK